MKNLLSKSLLLSNINNDRVMPKESIIVIAIFASLIVLTIILGIILLIKNKKAAKEAKLLNEKNNLEEY